MFGISFGELLLLLIVGLIVLGPQRLPIALKSVADWIKVLRRMSATVQLELSKELKLQELQDSLQKAEQSGLDSITPEIRSSINELRQITEKMQKDITNTTNVLDSSANPTQNHNSHIEKDKNE